ncbi:MAG: Gldg family protein [Rickettsiales bacterium]|nr:Gldg family protein [Rickettsiales bacterium]
MSQLFSPRRTMIYTMLMAVVIFVTINLVANRLLESSRFDLTQHHLFTLSSGTQAVLSAIDEPLTARLFYSEKAANGYPIIQNYATRMKGMLKQYAARSNGRLKLEIIDPEPFSENEDLAVAQGVQGVPIDTAGNKLFFGLSITNAVDEIQSIAFFSPERQSSIEYDLTRMIDRLSNKKKATLGILSWLPMNGTAQSLMAGQGPWAIYQQMQEFFDVKVLKNETDAIPPEVSVLLVAHPAPISDQTLYAIDQFMMRGGKAVFLIDPHTELDDVAEKTSDLSPLLSKWGLSMKAKYVAGDMDAAIRVGASDRVSALGSAPNVTWLLLKKPNFNAHEILTSDLNTMIMPTVGILEKTEGATATITPLITTGAQSFEIEQIKLMFAKEDPTILMDDMLPSEHPLMLAARVEGKLYSAFDKPPAAIDAATAPTEQLKESQADATFIVVADTDFIRDGFWMQKQEAFGSSLTTPSADNGAFLLNAIDYLSGNSALFGLRTRTTDDRRFTRVDAIRTKAESRFREEEERLREKLRTLETQLGQLQSQEGGEALLSAQQQEQLEKFRGIMVDTRRELRAVQHDLRHEIEALGSRLKLIHIGLIPLCVLLLGFWLPRRLGMKRH